jgi:hypothetical protein
MRRILYYGRNLLIWAVATVLGFIVLPHLWFAVAAIVVFIGYVISLVLHPRTRCWACGGTGRQRGALFSYAERQCTTCGGQARHRRWGSRAISSGQQVWAERAAARARQRASRPL